MTQGHEQPSTLHEIAYYPPHGPRDTDPNYRIFHSARHHLIDVLNVGCWIGGATQGQIQAGLPEGHLCLGATQLEAHHHIAEFAGLNALDWQKVAKDFPQLHINSDEEFLRAAETDGGLLILCSKHHRAPYHGIHTTSEPVWKLDHYAIDGWEFQHDPSTKETP